MRPNLFIPITKVDLEKQEVWGVAAEERTDKTGKEKFDYAESKPYFEQWIADCAARTATTGAEKSLGNIRYMHQPEAVGKAVDWQFDDAAKVIRLGAKVVDPAAWEKVKAGVLTGFSVGGGYAKRWPDPDEKGVTRYAGDPIEMSLVDNPCMWGATYDVIKADGSTELRKFHPKGDAMDLAAIEARCAALVEKLAAPGLRKNLYDAARIAQYLDDLKWVARYVKDECAQDAGKLAVAEQLERAVGTMAEAFLALCELYVAELTTAPAPMALSAVGQALDTMGAELGKALTADLAKGDPEAKAAAKRLQKMHDLAVQGGATCDAKTEKAAKPAEETDMDEATLTKALAASNADLEKRMTDGLAKLVGDAVAPLQKAITETGEKVGELGKSVEGIDARLKVVEATPAPTKGIVGNGVSKLVDTGGQPEVDLAKLTPEARGLALLKVKLNGPGQPLTGERPVIASI